MIHTIIAGDGGIEIDRRAAVKAKSATHWLKMEGIDIRDIKNRVGRSIHPGTTPMHRLKKR